MRILERFSGEKRFLIFNPSFIGDSVLTTPLIRALGKLSPEAEIYFCVRPESAPLFKNFKSGNKPVEVIVFNKRGNARGIKGIFSFSSLLKSQNLDCIISVHKSFRTNLLLSIVRKPFRVGFSQAAFKQFLSCHIYRDMAQHEVRRNLSLLSCITTGFDLDTAESLADGAYTYLDQDSYDKLTRLKESKNLKLVAISAGSVWKTKRWPVRYFAQLCAYLAELSYTPVITGGLSDKEVTECLKGMLDKKGIRYIDYSVDSPLVSLPAVLKCCDFLVSNDSSPVHIAASQNIPVCVIFGSTTPSLGFAPYGVKNIICEVENLSCRPCGLHGYNDCPKKHFKCMLDLKPEYVFNSIKKLMKWE